MKIYKVFDTLIGCCMYSSTVKADAEKEQERLGGEKKCYYLFEFEE